MADEDFDDLTGCTQRSDSVSFEQKRFLLGWMEDHRSVAQGEFSDHTNGRKDLLSEWERLRKQLHRISGPQKSVEQWKEVC